AIYNLEKVFDDLKASLRRENLERLVAFRQNEQSENKPLSVEEVVAVCTLFHPSFAEGITQPMKAYTSRASCVEFYYDEWEKREKSHNATAWKKGFGKIIHLA